ncbi:glycosyltransferase [archaeon]|nr:MAG: glycosyltransferase [archaeon]
MTSYSTLCCIFTSLLVLLIVYGFQRRQVLLNHDISISVTRHSYQHVAPPMKILVVVEPTPFNYVSGYANRFKEMLKYLSKAGDEVEIVTSDPDPLAPTHFLNFKIHSLKGFSFPLYRQIKVSIDLRFKLKSIIENFRPNLIHVSSPSALLLPTLFWAKRKDIPLVMSYHTDLVGYSASYVPIPGSTAFARFLVKNFHEQADLLLCTSPQLGNDMKQLGLKRVDIWQKGINTEIFHPKHKSTEMRQYLSEGDTRSTLLLYVGRLGKEKKIHRLKTVLQTLPHTRLAIVGSGPAESELYKELNGLPVFFAGQMVGQNLSAAFASADVFVMPSDTETLGFVVLEAQASGIPVVCVNAGGLPDIVLEGQTGYLAHNSEEFSDFTEKVRQLTKNIKLRIEMGQKAREYTETLSWENAGKILRNKQYKRARMLHRYRDERGRHVEDIQQAILEAEVDL